MKNRNHKPRVSVKSPSGRIIYFPKMHKDAKGVWKVSNPELWRSLIRGNPIPSGETSGPPNPSPETPGE